MNAAVRTFRANQFGAPGISGRSIGKPPAIYPAAVATDSDLTIAVDRQQTRLALPMNTGDTSMTVVDPSLIGAYNLLSIDSEIVKTTGAPVGNVVPISRGFDGTTAAVHLASAVVSGFIDAYHHNRLAAEIQAIEFALGPNLSRVPGAGFAVASQYDFAPQTPGGSLTVGANVITLSPVPNGVNGTDKNHYLWIDSGTGAPEAVKIIGGTAVSGGASGTVFITCANTHSGAWRISSATAGIQEAIITSSYVAVTAAATIHAPIYMEDHKELYGAPWGAAITQAAQNTDIIQIGDNGSAQALGCAVRGLVFFTSTAAWTSGYAINVRFAGHTLLRDNHIYGNNLIWRGINLYRCITANLQSNYFQNLASHGVVISGQDASNQSIDCNLNRNEFANCGGNPIFVGDWAGGLEFRTCIFNGSTAYAINITPTSYTSGVNINIFITDCDVEGSGIYVQNYANVQIVSNWLSTAAFSAVKLASTAASVLIASNIVTSNATTPAVFDIDGVDVVITGNSINGGGAGGNTAILLGLNSKRTTIVGNEILIVSTGIQINPAAEKSSIQSNTFAFIGTPIVGRTAQRLVTNNSGIDDVQPFGMTAAAVISPINPVQVVVGTGAINTVTVPDSFSGPLRLLPAQAWTWTATGNIAVAGAAVVGKTVELTFEPGSGKWYPSYV